MLACSGVFFGSVVLIVWGRETMCLFVFWRVVGVCLDGCFRKTVGFSGSGGLI